MVPGTDGCAPHARRQLPWTFARRDRARANLADGHVPDVLGRAVGPVHGARGLQSARRYFAGDQTS
eukprot:2403793-Rhodomonas_salina.1